MARGRQATEDCVGDNIYHAFAKWDKWGEGGQEEEEGSTEGILTESFSQQHAGHLSMDALLLLRLVKKRFARKFA